MIARIKSGKALMMQNVIYSRQLDDRMHNVLVELKRLTGNHRGKLLATMLIMHRNFWRPNCARCACHSRRNKTHRGIIA